MWRVADATIAMDEQRRNAEGISQAQRVVSDAVTALVGRSSSLSMHKFVLSKKLTKLTYKNKVCVLAGPAVLWCMLMHAPMLRSFIHSYTQTPHVELAKRLHARDPHSSPALGDRVPFVIVECLAEQSSAGGAGTSNSAGTALINSIARDTTSPALQGPHHSPYSLCRVGAGPAARGKLSKSIAVADKAEDPLFALEHDLPLDVNWLVYSHHGCITLCVRC